MKGGVVAQWLEHWTLDLWSTGRGFKSYSGQKLHKNFEQVVHTDVSLTKQYNLVPAKGQWCSAAGKVTDVWQKVIATYCRVDDLQSPVGRLPIHRDQLRPNAR